MFFAYEIKCYHGMNKELGSQSLVMKMRSRLASNSVFSNFL